MNPSQAQATVLVDELYRHGVRDVVLAPGSRSAPLAYALVARPDIRLHVRVDERSAAFVALGLARATGVPVAAVTTSGTAVANLHPAVLEAHHGLVPLVLLTADRPPELRGTGANQTTVQPGIFADATRLDVDLGTATDRPGEVAAWRGTVARVVAAATGALGGAPGPVHLNVGCRDPLVPGDGGWSQPLDGRPDGAPWTRLPRLDAASSRLDDVPRTVVVLGDLPDPTTAMHVCRTAAAAGWPVVAEPFGAVEASVLPHGPLLLTADWWRDHLPDRVLVVGRPTLARPVGDIVRHRDVVVETVTAGPTWPDPGHGSRAVHPLASLASFVPGPRSDEHRAWSAAWTDAGARLADAARDAIEQGTGLAVARTVLEALPTGAQLFVGPSNPVRDLDLGAGRRADVVVRGNRGLAGIDGCVSTAVGLALGAAGRTYALVGDLTFLHDANALLIGPGEERPDLTVVVVNDDGGGIFTTLEHGAPERADTFERVFGTPTGTDLAALCAAHDVPHASVTDDDALREMLRAPTKGIRVIEVPLDRARHRAAHERLRDAARTALAARDA